MRTREEEEEEECQSFSASLHPDCCSTVNVVLLHTPSAVCVCVCVCVYVPVCVHSSPLCASLCGRWGEIWPLGFFTEAPVLCL